jgi:hypothetical protein
MLERAMQQQGLTARAHDRILKVARTIADIEANLGINPSCPWQAGDFLFGMKSARWDWRQGLARSQRNDISPALGGGQSKGQEATTGRPLPPDPVLDADVAPLTFGPLNIVEVYDPPSNTWNGTPAQMPTPRTQLAAAVVNGKIYAIGGVNSGGSHLNTVEVYDPSSDTWGAAAPMPTARDLLAAADANGLIYAIGGLKRGTVNTVEQYAPPVTVYTFIKN